jgi:predicted RNase H-like HicB family nuclease
MENKVTKHKFTLTFEVDLERDENEDESRRYRAEVNSLIGCQVHAGSKAQAIRKIRQAVEIWLNHANRQFSDDISGIEEMIDMRLT